MKMELRLDQLSKMALGCNQINELNLTVLLDLINLILRKMDCYDDKVTLSGMEAKCLQKILKSSRAPANLFNEDGIEKLEVKLNRLKKLEEHTDLLQSRIKCHFVQIENSQAMGDIRLDLDKWDQLLEEAASEFAPCPDVNELACDLLNKTDFLKKLQRRITLPMIEALFELEEMVETLLKDMNEFAKMAMEHYKKLALFHGCVKAVSELKHRIENNYLRFLGAMEEVQDALDVKADKMYMPALKRFITKSLMSIESVIADMRKYVDCPKPPGTFTQGIRCLSCGRKEVCAYVGVHVVSKLPSARLYPPSRDLIRCKRGVNKSLDIRESDVEYSRQYMPPKQFPEKPPTYHNPKFLCKPDVSKIQLLEGTNGIFFRKS